MPRLIDLTGKVFGQLAVLRYSHTSITPSGQHKPFWLCRCECGTEKPIDGGALKNGRTISCGCHKATEAKSRMTKHGHTSWHGWKSPTYDIWKAMIQRCRNPRNKKFSDYGGRGITICDRWLDFRNFLTDMGECPGRGYSIDRKDNNGNYEPGNCHWATAKEQARNKRNNLLLTVDGETHCVAEWAELLGVSVHSLHDRIRRGWSDEQVVSIPIGQSRLSQTALTAQLPFDTA